MLPYQRRSGVTASPRTPETMRPTTRPVSTVRPSVAGGARSVRPDFAPVRDEEMTTMMPSRSAAALPPPPDAHTARIPRQWSPVEQVVGRQPTLPSIAASSLPQPTPLSVPAPPSSLHGFAIGNTAPSINVQTARVRTGALAKVARPTVSWAVVLVALGVFVGIGGAFMKSAESRATTAAAAAKAPGKAAKKAAGAKALAAQAPATPALPTVAALTAAAPPAAPVAPAALPATPAPVAAPAVAQGVAAPINSGLPPLPAGVLDPAPTARAMTGVVASSIPPLPLGALPGPAFPMAAPVAPAAIAKSAPVASPAAAPAPRRASRFVPAEPTAAAVPAPRPRKERALSEEAKNIAAAQLESLL